MDTEKELSTTEITTAGQVMEIQDCKDSNVEKTSLVSPAPSTTTNAGDDSSGKTKESRLFSDEMKFMKDFDPNQRLIQKKMKKFTESGVIVDTCDCLIPTCPGCHFYPCKTCGSHRCGSQCRQGRRWEYDELEIQGGPTVQTRKRVTNS